LGSFRQSGAQIAYLRDTPAADFDIPECVADSLTNWSRCAFPAPTVTEPIITGIASGRIKDVKVLDLNGYLCDGKTCPAVRNGTLLYRDNAHLTNTAVRLLVPAMEHSLGLVGLL
ncbi:MAG: acyltransferase, partial [Marmoricola sp.]|nr:acyltransferase [Marmoricola sp.]